MNDTTSWNQWEDIHTDPQQIKRQKSACKKDLTPRQVNETDCSATFKGSHGNYITTLSNCKCRDFALRKLPCKHMYRLAYELHLFKLPDTVLSDNTLRLNKEEAMQLISSTLTPDEQKEFGSFCYRCGNNNAAEALFLPETADKLLSAELAIEVTDVKKLLRNLTIANVRKFLPPGTKSPRTKVETIELVAPLVTKEDIIFPKGKKCLTLHPCVAHLGYTMHRQICAWYPEPDRYDFFDM